VSGFGHVKLSGSANAEAEIVIFSINQVVQMYQLKLVCSPEMRCSNLNIWNYHVLQMQHLKLPGGANAPCEAEVCFENEV
jgi:hypothetical protein